MGFSISSSVVAYRFPGRVSVLGRTHVFYLFSSISAIFKSFVVSNKGSCTFSCYQKVWKYLSVFLPMLWVIASPTVINRFHPLLIICIISLISNCKNMNQAVSSKSFEVKGVVVYLQTYQNESTILWNHSVLFLLQFGPLT